MDKASPTLASSAEGPNFDPFPEHSSWATSQLDVDHIVWTPGLSCPHLSICLSTFLSLGKVPLIITTSSYSNLLSQHGHATLHAQQLGTIKTWIPLILLLWRNYFKPKPCIITLETNESFSSLNIRQSDTEETPSATMVLTPGTCYPVTWSAHVMSEILNLCYNPGMVLNVVAA